MWLQRAPKMLPKLTLFHPHPVVWSRVFDLCLGYTCICLFDILPNHIVLKLDVLTWAPGVQTTTGNVFGLCTLYVCVVGCILWGHGPVEWFRTWLARVAVNACALVSWGSQAASNYLEVHVTWTQSFVDPSCPITWKSKFRWWLLSTENANYFVLNQKHVFSTVC
mgnify:CR=1 FL=1